MHLLKQKILRITCLVTVVVLFLLTKRPWLQARGISSFGCMTFTFSHDHVGITTVPPEDLDATIEPAEPGTWPGEGRAHA